MPPKIETDKSKLISLVIAHNIYRYHLGLVNDIYYNPGLLANKESEVRAKYFNDIKEFYPQIVVMELEPDKHIDSSGNFVRQDISQLTEDQIVPVELIQLIDDYKQGRRILD